MNDIGKNNKWYKKFITIVWYVPIQLFKEINQEKKEKKKRM